eukprot:sb/3472230/
MGGWFSSGPTAALTAETATQTEGYAGRGGNRRGSVPVEVSTFTPAQLNEMVALYKTHQASIDRSSIRGVRAKKDLYDSLTRRSGDQLPVIKPRLDPCTLHRQNHPKGYLTKITSDYEAQQDEEISVLKGTMVKVLRNHKDGRYEIYTSGGFGLVPGKILAYIQYEPDYA